MTAPAGRRRRWIAGGTAAAVAAAAAGAAVLGGGVSEDARAQDAGGPSATVEIERRDLVEVEELDGTLGYSDARQVVSALSGTVTWLPARGRTIRTNHRLLELDGEAVYLLDGAQPAYRTLEPGLSGRDVRQLERNLRELDLDPDGDMAVDGTWDAGTTRAVQRWQERKGLDETGEIELGRVVFQPGARRVAGTSATLGAAAGAGGGDAGAAAGSSTALLTTTSTRRIVVVPLPTTRSELASAGDRVRVELPDGGTARGRIASVGRVATLPEGEDADASDATLRVTVELTGNASGAGLDQAPVTVRFERSRKRDVLSIPVTALQAQAGGGFAVEVREGASRRLVAVEPGLYTSGDVEISGDGLREGMSVTDAEV